MHEKILQRTTQLAAIAGALTLAAGVAVLLGWVYDVAFLKTILPEGARMAPLTALCFVFAGLSVFSAAFVGTREPANDGQWKGRLSRIAAALVAVAAFSRLTEYILGRPSRIDGLWFVEPPGTSDPAVMVPAGAFGFVCVAAALYLYRTRSAATFQALLITSGLIAWLGASHYVYGGDPLLPLAEMAVHTAALFLLVSVGALCLRPDAGLLALLFSRRAGGVVARRLVPVLLVFPFLAGWLRVYGENESWFGTEAAASLVAVTTVVVFGTLVWRTAVLLEQSEASRQAAEDRSRAGEQLLASVIHSSLDAIIVMNHEGRVVEFNPAAEQIFGYRSREILGQPLVDSIIPPALRDPHRKGLARFLATGEARVIGRRLELTGMRSDGSEVAVELSIAQLPGNGPPTFAGFVRDITEQKRAVEALRESQQHYQALAESLPHLVWTCLPGGPCDYLSRQWAEYTGRPAEEQLGYGWADHLHPDDRKRVEAAWAEATRRGDLFDIEFRIRRADGVYRWFKTRAVPLKDASGRIVKWFGSNTDWDDQKRAEQKLHSQLSRMHLLEHITRAIGQRQDLPSIFQVVTASLEDNLPVDLACIFLYESATKQLTVSCAGLQSRDTAARLGLSEGSALPIDPNGLSRCVGGQLVYEPDIALVEYPFPQRLARGGLRAFVAAPLLVESKVFGVLVAARRQAASFSSGECEFLKQLSEHAALAAHQAELHDVLQRAYDDLRQTQDAVIQQERLRALGQMASGIAHDINNAISPVLVYTEWMLEAEPGLSKRARSYLEIMQRAVDDVAQTVARMSQFYRQPEVHRMLGPVDLNQLVTQVIALTRARWSDMPLKKGYVVEVRTELADSLPAVAGIESELREAFTNLVFNSVDSMPEGGVLTLRTSVSGDSRAPFVDVEIADTGLGMDEPTRQRCLEPFFTTKGERGTGLGLAMVYGVVQRHNAEIEIESEAGKGTCVRLRFSPTTGDAALSAEPTAAIPVPLRILIVDDDPILIKSLQDTLQGDGHVITTAGGGQEGIDLFRSQASMEERFAVVITDLGMPHVDGRTVAREIKKTSPSTPVILLTGWGQRLTAENDIPPYVDRVLSKPPKLRQLRDALAQVASARAST